MIEVKSSVSTCEVTGFIENGKITTHPCESGERYGDEICESINLQKCVDPFLCLPKGEYKITVTIERVA